MWLVVVAFSDAVHIVESWVVALEGLEEAFDLALGGRFSNGGLPVGPAVPWRKSVP